MARRRNTTRTTAVTIQSMPDEYVTCRHLGHAWDWYDVEILDRPRIYKQTVACLRCTATRMFEFDGRGYRTGRARTAYPDGYLIVGGGKDTVADRRAQARLEQTARRTRVTDISSARGRRRRAS